MTKLQHSSLLALGVIVAALAAVPALAYTGPSDEPTDLMQWQDTTIVNNKLRQINLLPPARPEIRGTYRGETQAQLAMREPTRRAYPYESRFEHWRDESVANNKLRGQMMLAPQPMVGVQSPQFAMSGMVAPPPYTESRFDQWRDESVINNKLRSHMGLWPN